MKGCAQGGIISGARYSGSNLTAYVSACPDPFGYATVGSSCDFVPQALLKVSAMRRSPGVMFF